MEAATGESRPNRKLLPNNAVTIETTLDTDFFKWWCICLRPVIPLTNREIEVIASFLKHRWELSKNKEVTDPALLDTIMKSDEIRKQVMEDCNITLQHFYVVMGNLRKKKIFINDLLNPKLIPNIREDESCFKFLILFKNKTPKE